MCTVAHLNKQLTPVLGFVEAFVFNLSKAAFAGPLLSGDAVHELKDQLMLIWREGVQLLQARGCMVGVGCAVVAGTSMLPLSTGGMSAKCTTGSSEVSCPVKFVYQIHC